MRPAVFFDKDGTLVVDVPYNVDPELIALTPWAREGVAALRDAGFAIVVVTNQSGIARGLFEAGALDQVQAKLIELIGPIDGFYICPHAGGCECRKPEPGLIVSAAADLELDLMRSWMVGDILNDIEAGARAGCRTILIDNGNETEWCDGEYRQPALRVADVGEAAIAILNGERAAA